MSSDLSTEYFTDDLDFGMSQIKMSPTSPPLDQGFDPAASWTGAAEGSGDYSGLAYSPTDYLDDSSYDLFRVPAQSAADATAVNNEYMDWSSTPSLSNSSSTYSPPASLVDPSPTFGSFFGAQDAEYLNNNGFVSLGALAAGDSWPTNSKKRGYSEERGYTTAASSRTTTISADSSSPPTQIRRLSKSNTTKSSSSKTKSKSSSRSSSSSSSAASSSKTTKSKSESKAKTASSSKSKSASTLPTPPSTSGHGGKHNVTLRTASRKPKSGKPDAATAAAAADTANDGSPLSSSSSSSSPAPAAADEEADQLTSEERRARQSHNVVEKQYRNRLNAQFEMLLAVLPAAGGAAEQAEDGDGRPGHNRSDDENKRMSKAEVLDMARRRIRDLERERRQLQVERQSLLENVGMMQRAVQRQRMVSVAAPI